MTGVVVTCIPYKIARIHSQKGWCMQLERRQLSWPGGGGWKCGSGKCRSRQSMESRRNKILGRLVLDAAVSACAEQQFATHSHRICEKQTLGNSLSVPVSSKTGYSSVHTAGGLTSHSTHYRSYRGRFYRSYDQTNSVKALKETSWSFR